MGARYPKLRHSFTQLDGVTSQETVTLITEHWCSHRGLVEV